MRCFALFLCLSLAGSPLAHAEVTFGPVQGDIELNGNGEFDCQLGSNNICGTCVQDAENPGPSTDPLIIAFGRTGLSGWSEGTVSGTVSPYIEVDGVTIPPSLLPTGSFFRSGFVVVSQVTPVRPCPDQGLSYQLGPVSGAVTASANLDIEIPASAGDVIPFQISFCSVFAFWGVGCGVAGSAQERWVLHMPEALHAATIQSGNPGPIPFAGQDITLDFEQSDGGRVSVLRSQEPSPVGPPLDGPTGYWEVNTDLQDGAFMAVVTVDFDLASLPSGINPVHLKLARYDTNAGAWESLASTVDLAAETVTATTDAFSVLVLTTDTPVTTTSNSWGSMKTWY